MRRTRFDPSRGWRLVGHTCEEALEVWERRSRGHGILAFVHGDRYAYALTLGFGSSAPAPTEAPTCDPGVVFAASEDLAAQRLRTEGEPTWEAARRLLPDLAGYTPIASECHREKPVIDPDGRIYILSEDQEGLLCERVLFDPATHVAAPVAPVRHETRLIGRWLPATHHMAISPEGAVAWETLALPCDDAGNVLIALIAGGEWRFFVGGEPPRAVGADAWFSRLLALVREWRERLRTAPRLALPEPRLARSSLAGIVRAQTVQVGDHPKYGLGRYAHEMHDGFPPTVLWLCLAEAEWGLVERARRRLLAWIGRFVREDGAFDYYGPAIAEYAELLVVAARVGDLSRAGGVSVCLGERLRAVAGLLLGLRAEALADATSGGLLRGAAEADTCGTEERYFAASAWAVRGLEAYAGIADPADPLAEQCREAARGLRADLIRAAESSFDGCFLPPYPGALSPFADLTEGEVPTYANYRYWPEMLSPDVLPRELGSAVEDYRRLHRGEVAGTTRFLDRLDDWPVAHLARHLLDADDTEGYLTLLYGHLGLHETPGTFCAYEQLSILPEQGFRRPVADFCVPTQLTTALLTKWMLLDDGWGGDDLWLCRAVPRRWLAPGETIVATNLATRHGPVGFAVSAEARRVVADLNLPGDPPPRVLLRLRLPAKPSAVRARADGRAAFWDAAREAVVLPRGARRVELRLE